MSQRTLPTQADRNRISPANRQEVSMKTLAIFAFTISMGVTVAAQATAPAQEESGLKIMRVGLQRTVMNGPSTRAVAPTDPAYQKNAKTDRMQDSESDSNPALQ